MSNISYPNKAVAGGGGNTYVEGNTVPATELQGDFDEVANKVNGQLDEDNLKAGTQIPQSKLGAFSAGSLDADVTDDHSDDAATALTQTTPGDSATAGANLATNLEGELERLRYRIHSQTGHGGSAQWRDSAGDYASTNWTEPPVCGPNLILNSAFEYHGGTATEAPFGWTLVGSPTNVAIEAAAHPTAGLTKRSLNIVSDASSEGLAQTIGGLKASTKYLFGVNYTVSVDGIAISTTGALGTSNDYQNGQLTDSVVAATVETLQLVVETDASGTDVVVLITSTDTTSDFNIHGCWFHELNDAVPARLPFIPGQTATHDSQETFPATAWGSVTQNTWIWETVTELSLSQYVPAAGYRLVYEADLVYTGGDGPTFGSPTYSAEYQQSAFRLQLDSGGGAADVDGPKLIWHSSNSGGPSLTLGGSITLKYVIDNPTPGLTYAFTVDVGAFNKSGDDDQPIVISPLSTDTTVQSVSRSRLTVERI